MLHLSKYTVDAGKQLARSKGDLLYTRQFQQVAAGRANLWPEHTTKTVIGVEVLGFPAPKMAGE
jgi:hypothetical protein